MATKMLNLNKPITSMAMNSNSTQMILGCADGNALIYEFNPRTKSWSKIHSLEKHTGRITGVDWASQTGKIVTVSSDRNAYVWQFNQAKNTWEPELVLLRLSRAATSVKWSPKEDKFAVGSSARLVTVCYWENQQKCWVSKHIKKPIKSTISCLDWHPNNYILAVGSTDMTCRVFSAYIKDIEEKPAGCSWGSKLPFGFLLSEFACNGWVSAVSFSGNGEELAFACHDSTLNVGVGGGSPTSVFYGSNNPFTGLEWNGANSVIGVGHDRCVFEFIIANGQISLKGKHLGKNANGSGSGVGNAMRSFQNMDLRRQSAATEVKTAHISPINDICIMDGQKGNVGAFMTSGGDGLVFMWNWQNLRNQLEN